MAEHIRWGDKEYSVGDNGELRMLPPRGRTPQGYAAEHTDLITGALSILEFTGYITPQQYETDQRNVPGFITWDTDRQFSGVPYELYEHSAALMAEMLGLSTEDRGLMWAELRNTLAVFENYWVVATVEDCYPGMVNDTEGAMTDNRYRQYLYDKALGEHGFERARRYELGCRELLRYCLSIIDPTGASSLDEGALRELQDDAARHNIAGEAFERLRLEAMQDVAVDLFRRGELRTPQSGTLDQEPRMPD